MSVLDWMRPPAPAGGSTQTSYSLTDHRRATSPKHALLVGLTAVRGRQNLPGKTVSTQQVVRVVPGLVPSTLGPHHPPSSDRPHVASRHLPRKVTGESHRAASCTRREHLHLPPSRPDLLVVIQTRVCAMVLFVIYLFVSSRPSPSG